MAAKRTVIDKSAVAADTKIASVLILFDDGVLEDVNLYDEYVDRFAREFIWQGVKVFVTATHLTKAEDKAALVEEAVGGVKVANGVIDRFAKEIVRQGLEAFLAAANIRTGVDKDSVSGLIEGAEKIAFPFDAIFQVGRFEWDTALAETRFFTLNMPGEPFTEVVRPQLEKKSPFMVKFDSPTLYAQGRLICVRNDHPNAINAQQIASIDMALPMNFSLPCNYVAEYEFTQRPGRSDFSEYKLKEENFQYKNADWRAKATEETEDRMIAAIVAKLLVK